MDVYDVRAAARRFECRFHAFVLERSRKPGGATTRDAFGAESPDVGTERTHRAHQSIGVQRTPPFVPLV